MDFKNEINRIFDNLCTFLRQNNIKVVMPTFYPQRGAILEEMAEKGVKCCILGGKEGVKLFKNVEQYGLEKDTTGMNETPDEQEMLINRLPKSFQEGKIIIHGYEQYPRQDYIKAKFPNVEVLSQTAQNSYNFFEEKVNLQSILEQAGLREHIIPNKICKVKEITNHEEIYNKLKNENGKIVIQKCGEGNFESGGGKSTYIVNSLEDFKNALKEISGGTVKIAKFINGAESNLSFFCSTKDLNKDGKINKHNLNAENDKEFFGMNKSLQKFLNNSERVDDNSIYTIVGKSTLKCVSSDLLTSSLGNGVGNDVGYVFENEIQQKIQNIGEKLGKVMAECGRSGLAGCDLIIDKQGKIWINEINDRQQGPTEQMSKDAENNGVLSLIKLAFITSHCNFENEKGFLSLLKEQSTKISQDYLNNSGNFYIKLNSTHSTDIGIDFKFANTLTTGYYRIYKENNQWNFDKTRLNKIPEGKEIINLANNEIFVKIDGKIKENISIETKKQLLRIEGKAIKGDSPFLMQNGNTILNPKWNDILTCIYNTVVKSIDGADNSKDSYQDFNLLLQKRLLKKYTGREY